MLILGLSLLFGIGLCILIVALLELISQVLDLQHSIGGFGDYVFYILLYGIVAGIGITLIATTIWVAIKYL